MVSLVDGATDGQIFVPRLSPGRTAMPFSSEIEPVVQTMYRSLREKDRRRYSPVEAAKLGHGGLEYIAALLGCDPKTIRLGQRALDDLPDVPPPRSRKK